MKKESTEGRNSLLTYTHNQVNCNDLHTLASCQDCKREKACMKCR